MQAVISIRNLSKTFDNGFRALDGVTLNIAEGEIFALLGPNGAGKTTLINTICGLVNPTAGEALAAGYDVVSDYRAARSRIGLVPQELTTDAFATVWNSVSFSRGLYGKPRKPAHIERVLKDLSLWDKRRNSIMTLSGGMKRRVMIAKALSHEPDILFLDEPTAGVDVELRRSMWEVVKSLRSLGVTIVLTTHYLEEAEQMADRVGVINEGRIMLVENKDDLMRKLGEKRLTLELARPAEELPDALKEFGFTLKDEGRRLFYTYDASDEGPDISTLFRTLDKAGIQVRDMATQRSSLEEIFVDLVHRQ